MAAKETMKFTGERAMPLDSATPDNVMIEHWARYKFAGQFAKGKRVLDVACGAGYGTDYLADTANEVIGGDICKDSIAYSREHYQRDNLSFLECDIRAIPLPDHSIDLVTSFETLEHITESPGFLAEIVRVLKKDGELYISTPIGKDQNPHHLASFTKEKFTSMLSCFFDGVEVLYQQGAQFFSESITSTETDTFIGEYAMATCKTPHTESKPTETIEVVKVSDPIEDFILSSGSDDLPVFGGRYEGGVHSQQIADELAALLHTIIDSGKKINSYLEVGSAAGGTAYFVSHFLKPEKMVLVDDNKHRKARLRSVILSQVNRVELIGSSTDPAIISAVKQSCKSYDLAIVDSGHQYEKVKENTANYLPMVGKGGFIVIHDTISCPSGPGRLATELKSDKSVTFIGEYITKKHRTPCGIALFKKK